MRASKYLKRFNNVSVDPPNAFITGWRGRGTNVDRCVLTKTGADHFNLSTNVVCMRQNLRSTFCKQLRCRVPTPWPACNIRGNWGYTRVPRINLAGRCNHRTHHRSSHSSSVALTSLTWWWRCHVLLLPRFVTWCVV